MNYIFCIIIIVVLRVPQYRSVASLNYRLENTESLDDGYVQVS